MNPPPVSRTHAPPSVSVLAALLLNPVRASTQDATPAEWFSALSDYLPAAYIDARSCELVALYAEGCTPRLAYIFARVHLLAPDISTL